MYIFFRHYDCLPCPPCGYALVRQVEAVCLPARLMWVRLSRREEMGEVSV